MRGYRQKSREKYSVLRGNKDINTTLKIYAKVKEREEKQVTHSEDTAKTGDHIIRPDSGKLIG